MSARSNSKILVYLVYDGLAAVFHQVIWHVISWQKPVISWKMFPWHKTMICPFYTLVMIPLRKNLNVLISQRGGFYYFLTEPAFSLFAAFKSAYKWHGNLIFNSQTQVWDHLVKCQFFLPYGMLVTNININYKYKLNIQSVIKNTSYLRIPLVIHTTQK